VLRVVAITVALKKLVSSIPDGLVLDTPPTQRLSATATQLAAID